MKSAFISYRRQDASTVARWLREKLLGFRPPRELLERVSAERRVDLERRVAYFLDTSYQSANEDFWAGNIEPALKKSEYTLVISSPSALLARPDGSDNWWRARSTPSCRSGARKRAVDASS